CVWNIGMASQGRIEINGWKCFWPVKFMGGNCEGVKGRGEGSEIEVRERVEGVSVKKNMVFAGDWGYLLNGLEGWDL
ncbi:hypothetical protein, partial [Siminovitchia fortis]|uniref:hypothetical protein n=1 Tax=Siminovitchia fortis TaxID=254758 RepID=UPI001C92E04C